MECVCFFCLVFVSCFLFFSAIDVINVYSLDFVQLLKWSQRSPLLLGLLPPPPPPPPTLTFLRIQKLRKTNHNAHKVAITCMHGIKLARVEPTSQPNNEKKERGMYENAVDLNIWMCCRVLCVHTSLSTSPFWFPFRHLFFHCKIVYHHFKYGSYVPQLHILPPTHSHRRTFTL